MKISSRVEVQSLTVIELTTDERDWLRGVMQNPLYGQDLFSEPKQDAEMRQRFWNALKDTP